MSEAGARYKDQDLQLYELYVKAGRLDDAKMHLSTFQDTLPKKELASLEEQLKTKPLPDDPEGAINKQ